VYPSLKSVLGGDGWSLPRPDHRKKENNNKGKAIPLEAWTVPEGSRSLRLPDFNTIGT